MRAALEVAFGAAILIVVGVFLGVSLMAPPKPVPPPPPEKTFNVLIDGRVIAQLKGDRIEAKDGCSLVIRKVGVDTIICLPHMITEATGEETSPTTEPKPAEKEEPQSGPTKLPVDGQLQVRI